MAGRLGSKGHLTRGVSTPLLTYMESSGYSGALLGCHMEFDLGWHLVRSKVEVPCTVGAPGDGGEEDCSHLFFECPFTQEIWASQPILRADVSSAEASWEPIWSLMQASGAGKAFKGSMRFGYTVTRLSFGEGRLQRTASSMMWKVLYNSVLEGRKRGRNDPLGHEFTH